jgi:AraC-like DNA-binding protein
MLIRLRMELACDLITNTDLSIGQIAQKCGYPSPSYFSAEYKKHFGVTPATHRGKR